MGLSIKQKKTRKLIQDRERRFKRMSRARKRVAIAKDVIGQLNAGKLIAKDKAWVHVDSWKNNRPSYGSNLRDELIKAKSCTTCAIGAIFVCAVYRDPRPALEDPSQSLLYDHEVAGRETIWSHLRGFFTDKQLRLIELAFEEGFGWTNVSDQKEADAVRFGQKYPDLDSRMRAIMNNIVTNNGIFNPPKVSQYGTS